MAVPVAPLALLKEDMTPPATPATTQLSTTSANNLPHVKRLEPNVNVSSSTSIPPTTPAKTAKAAQSATLVTTPTSSATSFSISLAKQPQLVSQNNDDSLPSSPTELAANRSGIKIRLRMKKRPVAQLLSPVQQPPVAVQRSPRPVQQRPVEQLQSPVQQPPVAVRRPPRPVQQLPRPVQQRLVEQLPSPVQQPPVAVQRSPRPVQQLPSPVQQPSGPSFLDLHALKPEFRRIIFEPSLKWDGRTSPALLVALRADDKLYQEALSIFRQVNVFRLVCNDGHWTTETLNRKAIAEICKLGLVINVPDPNGTWKQTLPDDFSKHPITFAQNLQEFHINVSYYPYLLYRNGGIAKFLKPFPRLQVVSVTVMAPYYGRHVDVSHAAVGAVSKYLGTKPTSQVVPRCKKVWQWRAKNGIFLEQRRSPEPGTPEAVPQKNLKRKREATPEEHMQIVVKVKEGRKSGWRCFWTDSVEEVVVRAEVNDTFIVSDDDGDWEQPEASGQERVEARVNELVFSWLN